MNINNYGENTLFCSSSSSSNGTYGRKYDKNNFESNFTNYIDSNTIYINRNTNHDDNKSCRKCPPIEMDNFTNFRLQIF
jgi:hypothetical protein